MSGRILKLLRLHLWNRWTIPFDHESNQFQVRTWKSSPGKWHQGMVPDGIFWGRYEKEDFQVGTTYNFKAMGLGVQPRNYHPLPVALPSSRLGVLWFWTHISFIRIPCMRNADILWDDSEYLCFVPVHTWQWWVKGHKEWQLTVQSILGLQVTGVPE